MNKPRNRYSIAFIFMSLVSGIAITQTTPMNAQDSIEEWYESRPPAQLCELYRSGQSNQIKSLGEEAPTLARISHSRIKTSSMV